MKHLTGLLFFLIPYLSIGQNIVQAEYFFDNDPGFGQGANIPITNPDSFVSFTHNISTGSLTNGLHLLFLRCKDDEGNWSLYEQRLISIQDTTTPGVNIDYAEYFFNTDPGYGNGMVIPINPAGSGVSVLDTISIGSLPAGMHNMFVRVRDDDGRWSMRENRLLYIQEPINPSVITQLEYFTDSAGAFGSGTPLPIVNPSGSIIIKDTLTAPVLPLGDHYLHLRAKDDKGRWSLLESRQFTLCSTYGPVADFSFYIKDNLVYYTSKSENADQVTWFFGDGSSDGLKENPSHVYLDEGKYDVILVAENICGSDTMVKTIEINGLSGITPNVCGNSTFVSTIIKGYGFVPGTTAKLALAGQTDLIPDTAIYIDPYILKANFIFDNVPLGSWDVIVDVPGSFKDTIFKGFEIQPVNPIDIWFELIGPGLIRTHSLGFYRVAVGNRSNVTTYGVPVTIFVTPNRYVELVSDVNTDSLPQVIIDSFPHFGLVKDTVLVDSFLMGSFVIPQILPGGTEYVDFVFRSSMDAPFEMSALVGKPFYDETNLDLIGLGYRSSCNFLPPCLQCLQDLAGFIPGPIGCASSAFNLGCLIGNHFNKKKRNRMDLLDLIGNAGGTALACASGGASKAFDAASDWGGAAGGMNDTWSSCPECLKPKRKKPGQSFTSRDPNIKEGPGGFTPENYISGTEPMYYTIYFENVDTATAPAAEVVVTDQLDTSKLDMGSFRFIDFGFGDSMYTVEHTGEVFVKDIDLRPNMDIILRVSGNLDRSTGELEWRFTSFDPDSMKLTTDALEGFLPPNINKPEGEGHVRFRVELKQGYQHLDVIQNQAEIVFDFNAPILTPVWTNTIDLEPPMSSVNALPVEVFDTSFTVSWAGTDPHAGVMDYTIYVIEDDTSEYLWKAGVEYTSATFTVKYGVNYKFYSVATDLVGNVELPPADPVLNPDAATTVKPTGIDKPIPGLMVAHLHPNPAYQTCQVDVELEKAASAVIGVTSLYGFTMEERSMGLLVPGKHSALLDLSAYPAGIYFVAITAGESQQILKLVVQR